MNSSKTVSFEEGDAIKIYAVANDGFSGPDTITLNIAEYAEEENEPVHEPVQLVMGENTIELADANSTYIGIYTADKTGDYTFTLGGNYENFTVYIYINDVVAGEKSSYKLDSETTSVAVPYTEGDKMTIYAFVSDGFSDSVEFTVNIKEPAEEEVVPPEPIILKGSIFITISEIGDTYTSTNTIVKAGSYKFTQDESHHNLTLYLYVNDTEHIGQESQYILNHEHASAVVPLNKDDTLSVYAFVSGTFSSALEFTIKVEVTVDDEDEEEESIVTTYNVLLVGENEISLSESQPAYTAKYTDVKEGDYTFTLSGDDLTNVTVYIYTGSDADVGSDSGHTLNLEQTTQTVKYTKGDVITIYAVANDITGSVSFTVYVKEPAD